MNFRDTMICRALALLFVALAGCAVGPNYHEPKTAMPANWTEAQQGGITNGPLTVVQWWTLFNDPILNALATSAVQSNLDLRVAAARVREARALRGLAMADFFPTGNAHASYTKTRLSKNAQVFNVPQLTTELFDAGFDATWELDIFGGKRRAFEAASADAEAAEAARRDVLISLLAEVARNYIEVRGLQHRLIIARDNIRAQQDAVSITRDRFGAGLTSELDVTLARTLLATTQAQMPTLETALQQSIHRLGVLLGQPPGALQAELSTAAPVPATPPEVPVGLPSELLRRRPDVRRAERSLAAVTARLGQATAEFFPKFTLVGTAGLSSLHASDWFTAGSRFWTAGPGVTWRILDVGQISSGVRAADARQQQVLAQYEQTVLTSLEDVENALVAYAKEQDRRRSLAEGVEASRRAVELANQLYIQGLTDFLKVLTAEQALYATQDQLVQSEQTVSQNLVALYKALGGGWESEIGTKVTKQ